MNLNKEALAHINTKIAELMDELNISDQEERIIRLRYGLDNEAPASFKEMSKIMKISPKELKEGINKADRKVFNILKKHMMDQK